jgi:hypothetical protein
MAVYFVIFGRSEQELEPTGSTWEKAKVLEPPKEAQVVKLEAENVAEAQTCVEHFYPGSVTGTPVVVTEAQYKES